MSSDVMGSEERADFTMVLDRSEIEALMLEDLKGEYPGDIETLEALWSKDFVPGTALLLIRDRLDDTVLKATTSLAESSFGLAGAAPRAKKPHLVAVKSELHDSFSESFKEIEAKMSVLSPEPQPAQIAYSAVSVSDLRDALGTEGKSVVPSEVDLTTTHVSELLRSITATYGSHDKRQSVGESNAGGDPELDFLRNRSQSQAASANGGTISQRKDAGIKTGAPNSAHVKLVEPSLFDVSHDE
ncbi:hypothetical protein HDU91_006145 [Kappamyces sp. JEL0680]|nr:hypothetical protein HDU91_006145 [Kappamyces sp. JEL0680]